MTNTKTFESALLRYNRALTDLSDAEKDRPDVGHPDRRQWNLDLIKVRSEVRRTREAIVREAIVLSISASRLEAAILDGAAQADKKTLALGLLTYHTCMALGIPRDFDVLLKSRVHISAEKLVESGQLLKLRGRDIPLGAMPYGASDKTWTYVTQEWMLRKQDELKAAADQASRNRLFREMVVELAKTKDQSVEVQTHPASEPTVTLSAEAFLLLITTPNQTAKLMDILREGTDG